MQAVIYSNGSQECERAKVLLETKFSNSSI